MTPIVITESAVEPIDLAEAAGNIRAVEDGSGSYIEASRITKLIKAARQACEEELEMSLVAKTLEISRESFEYTISLPQGPVRSIVSVKYLDADSVDTVLATSQYRFSAYDPAPVLMPAYNVSWPATRGDTDAVRVRYTVGYPSGDSPPQVVPEPIRQAMHLYIAHYFANREAVDVDGLMELPMGVRYLLGKYRRGLGV